MAPKKEAAAAPALKALRERGENARGAALYEVKNLQKDLAALEKILVGRKPLGSFSLLDLVQSALEINRTATAVFETETLVESLEKAMGGALAEDELRQAGATLLKKPAGWHWISPKGEMHLLGKGEEPEKALEKLRELMAGGRRKAKPEAAVQAEPGPPAQAEPQPAAS